MLNIPELLLKREIYGISRTSDYKKTWSANRSLAQNDMQGLVPDIVWVQAKQNLMVCLNSSGGLIIFNTLDNFSQIYLSPKDLTITKVWFGRNSLYFLSEISNILSYYSFSMKSDSFGEVSFTQISNRLFPGCSNIEVTASYIIASLPNSFLFHNLLSKSNLKCPRTPRSRYCKGHILDWDDLGNIFIYNICTESLTVVTMEPPLNYLQIDLIKETYLLMFSEDNGIKLMNICNKSLNRFEFGEIMAYVEIENSGESLILFENSKIALASLKFIVFEADARELTVCDNDMSIFLLTVGTVYVLSKVHYHITSVIIGRNINVIGCNQNEDEFYAIADQFIYTFQ